LPSLLNRRIRVRFEVRPHVMVVLELATDRLTRCERSISIQRNRIGQRTPRWLAKKISQRLVETKARPFVLNEEGPQLP
jgi:hypothetical protein